MLSQLGNVDLASFFSPVCEFENMDDSISVCIPLVNGISGICYSWRNLDVKTSSQNQGCCKWLGKRQFVPPKHILKGGILALLTFTHRTGCVF